MKTLIIILLLLITSISYGQTTAKVLTTTDRNLDVYCQSDWLMVSVGDSAAADTITVSMFAVTQAQLVGYATVGTIKEIATNENVVALYGDADVKVYYIWLPYPGAIRFTLSQYASGNVYIKASGKP